MESLNVTNTTVSGTLFGFGTYQVLAPVFIDGVEPASVQQVLANFSLPYKNQLPKCTGCYLPDSKRLFWGFAAARLDINDLLTGEHSMYVGFFLGAGMHRSVWRAEGRGVYSGFA